MGTDDNGAHRLTLATNSGRYEISDDVGCDWNTAKCLIDAARVRAGGDAIALLRAALQLVEGRIPSDISGRNYSWLKDDHQIYGQIERVLVDAAHRLGELALDAGDHDLARWSAGKGLCAVPGQESLFRLQMKAAYSAGDTQGIRDAHRSACIAASAIGQWSEVQPETEALYRELQVRSED